MKRRLIQLAKKTLVVSLPNEFVKKYNLKKGDEVDLLDKNNRIFIDFKSEMPVRKAVIDISNLNKAMVWNYLLSIYRKGADEIKVLCDNPEIEDVKKKELVKTTLLIQQVTNRLIGMEIIKQDQKYMIIKEVTSIKEEEFDNVLRRIFFSLLNLAEDSLNAIKNKNKENLENIFSYTDVNLNKLSDFCMRILNKKGHNEIGKTALYYFIITQLEEVGDSYIYICELVSKNMKIDKGVIMIYEELNELLKLFHETFYNFKRENIVKFHSGRSKVKAKINEMYKDKMNDEIRILSTSKLITNLMMQIINAKISMEEN